MSKNSKRFRQRLLDVTSTWGIGALLIAAAFFFAYQFVEPAPPNRITLATGEEGGSYQLYGEKLAAYMAEEGVTVELLATAGSVENLTLLEQQNGVDIGFVQGGLSEITPTENVVALGSLYLEPLWIFLNAGIELPEISDLQSRRLAVGAEGSGTRAVVSRVLDANGVNGENAELFGLAPDELAGALVEGNVDAAFLIAGPESEYLQSLIGLPGVRLFSLRRAAAFVRQYPFLSRIVLPEGVLNLRENVPEDDVEMIALTAMLAANRELHPALVDLLLVAAEKIHGQHSLLSDAGTFPTPQYIDLPLNEEADRHYRRGPPFLMRYLPFWAATLVDRLWVMLLPLLGLAIPLIKLVPPAYRWQIRRRLLRIYSQLEDLDPARKAIRDEEDRVERLEVLAELEQDSTIESLPREYIDDVYKLRRDIDLVRRRLNLQIGI